LVIDPDGVTRVRYFASFDDPGVQGAARQKDSDDNNSFSFEAARSLRRKQGPGEAYLGLIALGVGPEKGDSILRIIEKWTPPRSIDTGKEELKPTVANETPGGHPGAFQGARRGQSNVPTARPYANSLQQIRSMAKSNRLIDFDGPLRRGRIQVWANRFEMRKKSAAESSQFEKSPILARIRHRIKSHQVVPNYMPLLKAKRSFPVDNDRKAFAVGEYLN
jgi:hypothetical protein